MDGGTVMQLKRPNLGASGIRTVLGTGVRSPAGAKDAWRGGTLLAAGNFYSSGLQPSRVGLMPWNQYVMAWESDRGIWWPVGLPPSPNTTYTKLQLMRY